MNCVMIVIDSLNYTRVEESKEDLLPFLHTKGQNGIVATNMYSMAPYTEAAAMALYGGQKTLSNHGYLKRYAEIPKLLFESFLENGFDVFFNALQPQCFPSSLRRGCNYIYYNRGYDLSVLWSYRFSHYAKLQKERLIEADDYLVLCEIMHDNFSEWLRFLNDVKNNDSSVELIIDLNPNYDFEKALDAVNEEFNKFKENEISYIQRFLSLGKTHELYGIPYFKQIQHHIEKNNRISIDSRCKKIFNRIQRLNLKSNLLHNPDVFLGTVKAFKELLISRNKQDFLNSMYLIKNTVLPVHFKDRYGEIGPKLKGVPSFNTMSKHFLKWIDKRTNDKPFFACLHVDDIHFPEVFFSYDSNDLRIVNEDLNVAESYLKRNSFRGPGGLLHDLSLLYADHQCEWLYNELMKRNLLDDTIFVVTADHGFSYSGYPIRKKPINTFYLENFKIPFYVFGPGIKHKTITSMKSSASIPSTICEIMGVPVDKSYMPSITNDNEDMCFVEYCGGGCPDLKRREIMLAAFDKCKMVAFKSCLNDDFLLKNISEVYDLKEDPKQRKNKVNDFSLSEYAFLIDSIEKRFNELKKENGSGAN